MIFGVVVTDFFYIIYCLLFLYFALLFFCFFLFCLFFIRLVVGIRAQGVFLLDVQSSRAAASYQLSSCLHD